ncbi:hypothetical protein PM3016_5568 [Paenibacillus mucilaginosus 3016]|uniref:Uncharacterized protein n=1 Tax=Paenibacillus mucilaginosus 3016 TaxID=1116391 RepID=H6NIF1_9BACL|nr:hypothetical protein [Paenibacillus mucilaginosus]AFC32262.1 hypothetical protein PM3016_5568 [Paenibacillus mucilaginosus 3016]
MKFVEFLLSNWFILVIGYILVTSFLRKARGCGGEEQPPRRAMPPFGGGGEGGWPTRPAAPPAARPAERPSGGGAPFRRRWGGWRQAAAAEAAGCRTGPPVGRGSRPSAGQAALPALSALTS